MNDKQIDELINKVLREDQTLPEGLSERLEQQIDAWAAAEKKETIRSSFRRRSLYWLSGAAAVALLCIGIFQFTTPNEEHQLADPHLAEMPSQDKCKDHQHHPSFHGHETESSCSLQKKYHQLIPLSLSVPLPSSGRNVYRYLTTVHMVSCTCQFPH